MTQVWQGDKVLGVTRVTAGPCAVVQVKNQANDGYESVVVGYGEKKEKKVKKPEQGRFRGLKNFRHLREFRVEPGDLKRGDEITINTFAPGDKIQVSGISKGKGFQGVVRRHGFKGAKKSHGTKDQVRMPGSIGSTGPAHVFKGMRMAGRMGGGQVTTKNLEVVAIEPETGSLLIKGAVPGARNSLVLILGEGELTAERAEAKIASKTMDKAENGEKDKTKDKAVSPGQVEKEVIEAKEKVEAERSKK